MASELNDKGFNLLKNNFFDTIVVEVDDVESFRKKAERQHINFRYFDKNHIGISIDETTTISDLFDVINSFDNDIDPVFYKIDDDTS